MLTTEKMIKFYEDKINKMTNISKEEYLKIWEDNKKIFYHNTLINCYQEALAYWNQFDLDLENIIEEQINHEYSSYGEDYYQGAIDLSNKIRGKDGCDE